MVVVVANASFEPRGRTGRLNAPEQPLGREDTERVIHRLDRDGADLGPDGVGDRIGSDVRLSGDGAQDGQPLGRHLNSALPEELSRIGCHGVILSAVWNDSNIGSR